MTFEAVGSEVTMGVRRHRRYSAEFKLQLVESYLAGDGSAKGLADEHGICHSLILIWAEKYRKGELTLDVQREEQLQDYQLKDCSVRAQGGAPDDGAGPPEKGARRRAPSEQRQLVDYLQAGGVPVARGCRLSGLARSTYYRRPDPERAQVGAATDAALWARIEAITGEFPGYGYRRVTHELRRRGTVVNHKRIARVMRESALAARPRRRFVLTTDSAHDEPVFPNLLRDVAPDGPNQVWVADLTYLRLEREFAYLAVILDAWSRKVVGYAVGHLLDARLPLAALEAALESRRPPPGLIHHSDRGVQYASRR